jgi:hypothetical protein
MAAEPTQVTPAPRVSLAIALVFGAAVAAVLGVYARVHTAAGRPLFTLGFSGMLQMKAWLTTVVVAFAGVQLLTALWMWGRLPGAPAPAWVAPVHRASGAIAFLVSLPVAFHCIWALGFGTGSTRVLAHGIVGCVFYGAYAAKMLSLRLPGVSSWALPVLGGTVLACVVLLWLTAGLWFFTRSGLPLT